MTSPIAIDRSSGKSVAANRRSRKRSAYSTVLDRHFSRRNTHSPGHTGKYHIGGAWLATHTGALVVPVAHNAGEFWEETHSLKILERLQ